MWSSFLYTLCVRSKIKYHFYGCFDSGAELLHYTNVRVSHRVIEDDKMELLDSEDESYLLDTKTTSNYDIAENETLNSIHKGGINCYLHTLKLSFRAGMVGNFFNQICIKSG